MDKTEMFPLLNKFHPYNNHLHELLSLQFLFCVPYEKLNDPYDCRPKLSDEYIRKLFQDEESIKPYYNEFLKMNFDGVETDPMNFDGFNPNDGHDKLSTEDKLNLIFKNEHSRELFYSAYTKIYNIKVVSFSSINHSSDSDVLMWSHYANRFCGVRLTFDFSKANPDKNFIKPKDFFKVNYLPIMSPIETDDEFFDCYQNKTDLWQHEKEYRLIFRGKHNYISFDKECLDAITFGHNMKYEERKSVMNIVQALGYRNTRFYILVWTNKGLREKQIYF